MQRGLAVLAVFSTSSLLACGGALAHDDLFQGEEDGLPPDVGSPEPPSCSAIGSTCGPGEREVSAQDCSDSTTPCRVQGITCGGRVTYVRCLPDVVCTALPACPAGDVEVPTCPSTPATSCYPRTVCGATIYCVAPEEWCPPPQCEPGDVDVTALGRCPAAADLCYDRIACGITITCAAMKDR